MNEKLKNYYNRDAVSQSMLKALYRGVGFFKKEEKFYFREKEHWVIGDAVDVKLTRPDDFDDEFFISEILQKKSKGAAISIAKYVWDSVNYDEEPKLVYALINNVLPYFEDMVKLNDIPNPADYSQSVINDVNMLSDFFREAFEMHEYGGDTWTTSRKIKSVMKSILPYWKALLEANGRQIISQEELKTVDHVVSVFKEHPYIHEFLDHPELDREYQIDIDWEKLDIPCKGLLDMVIRNNSSLTIELSNGFIFEPGDVVIVDFKTTSRPAYKIENSIREYRYDVQLGWYYEGLSLQTDITGGFVQPNIRCIILAVSTLQNDTPVVWEMTQTDLDIAKWGAFKVGPKEYVPYLDATEQSKDWSDGELVEVELTDCDLWGYEAMLILYMQHKNAGVWNTPIDLFNNKGIIKRPLW